MVKYKKLVSTYVPLATFLKLIDAIKRLGCSKSWYAARAIEEKLEREKGE